jgi:hypothetical protein
MKALRIIGVPSSIHQGARDHFDRKIAVATSNLSLREVLDQVIKQNGLHMWTFETSRNKADSNEESAFVSIS